MKKALPPIIFPTSRIIILGSMPGEKSLELQQYYGNRGNHFWKLLYSVFELPFESDYNKRVEFLKKHGIALWDVLAFCEREGSLDSNIKNEAPNDIAAFLGKHPSIQFVVFSSKAAEKYYNEYLPPVQSVRYFVLPSPSGANASKSFIQKLEAWQILKTLS